MFSEEHLYAIALRKCTFIGDINFQKLVNAVGSAKEVWELSKSSLKNIYGIGKQTTREIGTPDPLKFAEKELKFCEKNGIQIRLRHLEEYPRLLQECDDAPAILYQKGNFGQQLKTLSIVGTRNLTGYGKQFLEQFLDELKNKNAATVSGLALGTDSEVHEISLKNHIPTIGVLAHGFHTFYPAKNKKLSERILENSGALFTEFNSSQKPDRENFIQRNRVIAGLSPATIVVETAFGGGSISTATFANTYNREVYALPGKVTEKYSQGCNQLILQNKASIISTVSDLMDSLGFSKENSQIPELFPVSEIRKELPEDQLKIYTCILENPHITLDEISEILTIPSYKILPILLELELSGFLNSFSGKQYSAR